MSFKVFSIFRSHLPFYSVEQNDFFAILVEGHPRNTPVKLFLKLGIDLGGDVV